MPERRRRSNKTEYLQTSFLAQEDAALMADLTRLRLLISEVSARYARRLRGVDGAGPVQIHSPRTVAELLMPEMQELPYEDFRVLALNTKNAVLDVIPMYRGTLNHAPIRVAEVFRPAIVMNAASIIAVHCHPSGDPTPSSEDVRITAEIVKGGEILDVACLDHIIIGRERFVSLKERRMGFP